MPVHRLPRPSGPVADGERLAAYSCGGSRGIGASSSPHSLLIPEGNRRDHDRAVFLSVQPGSRPLPDIAQAAKLFGNRSVAVEPGDGNCGGMGRQTLISAQPELRRTITPLPFLRAAATFIVVFRGFPTILRRNASEYPAQGRVCFWRDCPSAFSDEAEPTTRWRVRLEAFVELALLNRSGHPDRKPEEDL